MHVIFIGGFLDKSTGIVREYQLEFEALYPEFSSEYFQWHEKKKLKKRIQHINKKFLIIGHSYGATTALHVLKDIEIELLVTVDIVGRIWSRKNPRVKRWINIYAKPLEYNFSDYVAFVGGKWGYKLKNRVDEHHTVTCSHGSFWKMMQKIGFEKNLLEIEEIY